MLRWLDKFLNKIAWDQPARQPDIDATDGRSHPCPGCRLQPSYRGYLCDACKERFDLWCPCGTIAPYEVGTVRDSLPGYITCELCNRCNHRIKSICEAMDRDDDDEIDRLIKTMRDKR